ncbi:helix-turn-helix domain-containing protein [Enterococcus sp. LJL128]
MNGYMFDNLRFFGLFPELAEADFQRQLNQLAENQFIIHSADHSEAALSEKGRHLLVNNSQKMNTHWLNSYRYGKTEEEMWRLLQFSVQVTSQLSYQNKEYIPLESSPYYQWMIKQTLTQLKKNTLGQEMRRQWHELFIELSQQEQAFIAQQFSGYQHNGKALQQLANQASSSDFEAVLFRKNTYHHLFAVIESKNQNQFLQAVIHDSLEKSNNQSMRQTKELWQTGYSLEEIAVIRKMKVSTVKDHLLELAIQEPEKNYDSLLPKNQQAFLDKITTPCQTWRFTTLKAQYEPLDYFSFRLYQILKLRREYEA